MSPALTLNGLSKAFGQTQIIRGVDLEVSAQTRHAIIGPNGAGKSTLFNLISGAFPPSGGRIILGGSDITREPAHRRARRGLARSFQVTNLFSELTVSETLMLAVLGHRGPRIALRRRLASYEGHRSRVDELLALLRLDHRRDVATQDLAYSEQRALEFAATIAGNPSVILLDEPTAGMSRSETDRMIDVIRTISDGRTLVMVEHDMGVVFEIADRISVLVYGQILRTGTPQAVREDRDVKAAYLGEAVNE